MINNFRATPSASRLGGRKEGPGRRQALESQPAEGSSWIPSARAKDDVGEATVCATSWMACFCNPGTAGEVVGRGEGDVWTSCEGVREGNGGLRGEDDVEKNARGCRLLAKGGGSRFSSSSRSRQVEGQW